MGTIEARDKILGQQKLMMHLERWAATIEAAEKHNDRPNSLLLWVMNGSNAR